MQQRKKVTAVALFAGALVLFVAFYAVRTAQATSVQGQTRVLQGIPAIAKAFAPLYGVKWEDFAKSLAGICAVESKCDPSYPHYAGGKYSQYQGLYQMNMTEVVKAENNLSQMMPRMQAGAQSGQIPKEAVAFVEKAVQAGRSGGGDRRFHPEYGVILGAAKHIQIQKQLEEKYPDKALYQAAAHMTAQFSGVTEAKIRARNFTAPITGNLNGNPASSEAAALGVNQVRGDPSRVLTVDGAIKAAEARYGKIMGSMMAKMSQVTNGMTSMPTVVAPFTGPKYNPGQGPQLAQPYNAVSTLMETGYIAPEVAAPVTPVQNSTLPPLNQTQSGAPLNYQQPTTLPQTPGSGMNTPQDMRAIMDALNKDTGIPKDTSSTKSTTDAGSKTGTETGTSEKPTTESTTKPPETQKPVPGDILKDLTYPGQQESNAGGTDIKTGTSVDTSNVGKSSEVALFDTKLSQNQNANPDKNWNLTTIVIPLHEYSPEGSFSPGSTGAEQSPPTMVQSISSTFQSIVNRIKSILTSIIARLRGKSNEGML